MGGLFRLIELLLLILPLVGLIAAGIKAISSMSRRAGEKARSPAPDDTSGDKARGPSTGNQAAHWAGKRIGSPRCPHEAADLHGTPYT